MSFTQECFCFMDEHGLGVANENKIKLSGDIERYTVSGDKRGSLNGWMVYRDGIKPSCTFGSWKTGEIYTWFCEDITELSKKERAEMRKQQAVEREKIAKIRREDEEKRHIAASVKAMEIYNSATATTVISGDTHPYVAMKQITPYNAKIEESTGCLIVPVMRHDGCISSIQRIMPSGRKQFLPDGMIRGCFVEIGHDTKFSDLILITEGYATGCTLHEVSQCKVIVCFNASNIALVSRTARQKYPDAEIIICADNDHQTEINGIPTNVGELKAIEATKGMSSMGVLFLGTNEHGTDWNDYYVNNGYDETCAWFSFRMDALRKGEPKEYV